jgi:alpha-tubulin suppressor-like RCC1 family protein
MFKLTGLYRRPARFLWVALLAALFAASVVPASASESSGAAAWGENNDGQLGNGTTTTEKEAVAVKVITEATAVAGGELHSLALLKSGKVMAWGYNNDGQLGNGTTTTEKEPVEVKGLSEVIAIAAGADHSLALLKDGKVMAWGYNNDGQLGNGTTTTEKEPVEVKGLSEVIAIAAGADHSLAVLKSGKVKAWGYNNDGQLGNGTTTTEKEPVEVKGLSEATAVAGGEYHSLALLASGEVKAWGYNNDGQLGNGTTTTEKEPVEVKGLSEVAAIAAGHSHSLAVLKSGKVKAWGDNNDGQLGNGTTTTEKEPVEVKALTEATAVAGGQYHSLALLKNGKIMAWGDNEDGQLGNGTTTTEKEPVEVKGLGGAASWVAAGANFSLAAYAIAPANVSLPAISGKAEERQTLTASTGTWTGTEPITYTYQWQSCNSKGESCSNISGATSSTYKLASSNVGGTVRVEVTAKNVVKATSVFSAVTSVVTASLPENTTLPAISGTAESGQLLTVSNGSWEGTVPISYGYQWESCNSKGESCSNVSGATASSYRVPNSEVGDTLRAIVTASNSAGSTKATSAATATLTTGPPVNIGLPAIAGKAEEGQVLTASTGEWGGGEPITYTYKWQSCNSKGESCSTISGATSSTFSLTASYVGKTLRVIVTAKNSIGSTEGTSSVSAVVIVPGPPSNTALPTVSGATRDGQTLIASTGAWTGTTPISYAYQWQSCNLEQEECQNVGAATAQTYTLSSANLETTLRVVVTATNTNGSVPASSTVTAEVEPGAPSEFEAPSISGNPNARQTLYAAPGAWGGTETNVSYQWERCNATGSECAQILGATGSAYEIEEAEAGDTLRLRVGVSNALGSVTAFSPATEVIASGSPQPRNTVVPSISGTPGSGKTLTANAGSWLGEAAISYSYQWESCNSNGGSCKNIAGATASTYVLGSGSVGDTIRVRVSASDTLGSAARTSAATAPIAPENDPSVEALPTVSGTGLKGSVLTATSGGWSGLVGSTSYGYQWERCGESGEGCSTISGATANTYTLTESDVASTLRVLVTATDERGTTTAPSDATAVISPATLVNVARPSISGPDAIEQALSAEKGIWTGEGALTYAYTWELCNEKGEGCGAITGATEPSYIPTASDLGKTLKVIVTAEGAAGKESVASVVTPVIASVRLAPTDLFAPAIEGNLTPGETVTAQKGTWVSSETISYSYQWQKCNEEGEGCANITGATSSAYKLIEGDVNSTLRVIVTGENAIGKASETSEASETVTAAGPPKNTNRPSINGAPKLGERLTASNGSWSGSRPLAYYYRWERCNTSGESCTVIEGATKPSYTAVSADVGSTLRAKVTTSNSLGSAGAVSTQTAVVASSAASATSAIELAEKTDPSVLQPAAAVTIEGQEIKPAVSDSGEWLTGTTTLTGSSTSKETPGEFAVSTPAGELSFEPIGTASTAAQTPTIVNGGAALFAGTSVATDTIVRADALGASTLLQLHSSEAPTSFSWEVGLGPDQRLEKLSNGDIAVVEIPATSPFEGSLGEALGGESSEATGEHEGTGANSEAAEKALEEGISEENPLEKLPAAPTATTPAVEPKSGELHPQETKALYENGKSAVTYAEEHTSDTTLMVIEPPKAMDAKGSNITASLSIENDNLTLTLSPGGGATYPITAETNVVAPTNAASEAKAHSVRYGLSDPKASSFTEAEEEPGKTEANFDSHLKSGPLHVGVARDIIPYNWHATNPELDKWLEAVGAAGLQPYITFTVESGQFCHPGQPCKETGISSYEAHVKELIAGLMKLHKEKSAIPAVTVYGAWNEPDLNKPTEQDPLYKNAKRAALFWKAGRAILRQVGCSCTMVAGEFSEDDGYINKYLSTIQKNHSLWPGKPHIWGFHDYEDLERYYSHPYNSYAEAFIKKIKRLGGSHVWLSEQGVMLQNGGEETKLDDSSQAEDATRQRDAAKDFLKLGGVHLAKELSRVELVDYYLYKGPTAATLAEPGKEHAFDSALLAGTGVTQERGHPVEDPRQAYCVLALGLEGCPAVAKTEAAVSSTITSTAGTVALAVNPEGAATKYLVEYGTSEAYGKTTAATAVANENGEQSETAAVSGLVPCTTYHYQAEAENKTNEEDKRPGLGGDKTFKTQCSVVSIGTSEESACAVLVTGDVDCWGSNEHGQLGDGSEESSAIPVRVSGLTDATAVHGNESGNMCALLSTGHVDCWGEGLWGALGDGSEANSATPVAVTGITNATAVSGGDGFACALLSTGKVECWGINDSDQLGNGGRKNSSVPVPISGITGAVTISSSLFKTCAVLTTGHVECWGRGEFETTLGDGKTEESAAPIAVSGITNATQISTNDLSTCMLVAEGGVKCWGVNAWGALGTGTDTGPQSCQGGYSSCYTTPVAVAEVSGASEVNTGEDFGCARFASGHVDCWGLNEHGELGDGTETGPEHCGEEGAACSTTPIPVSGLAEASKVSGGGNFACAALSEGGADCWGNNKEGQLGDGTTKDSLTPTRVEGLG